MYRTNLKLINDVDNIAVQLKNELEKIHVSNIMVLYEYVMMTLNNWGYSDYLANLINQIEQSCTQFVVTSNMKYLYKDVLLEALKDCKKMPLAA